MNKSLIALLALTITIIPVKGSLNSLLIGIDKIEAIQLADPPQEYISNDLFVMINGGAETYIEYGFQQALDTKYMLDSNKLIAVQIYEMSDDGAAFGVFTSTRNEGDHSFGIGDYSSGNDYYVMVQKNKYYYVVSAEEITPELQKAIIDIAASIANEIHVKGTLPEIVKKALLAGYSIDKLKYIRGKIALSGNYFFAHQEILKTRDAICIEDGDNNFFIFQYSDNTTAISNLKFINEELVASGRYTQFKVEKDKFNCLDKNLKQVKMQVINNHILVSVGKELTEEKIEVITKTF